MCMRRVLAQFKGQINFVQRKREDGCGSDSQVRSIQELHVPWYMLSAAYMSWENWWNTVLLHPLGLYINSSRVFLQDHPPYENMTQQIQCTAYIILHTLFHLISLKLCTLHEVNSKTSITVWLIPCCGSVFLMSHIWDELHSWWIRPRVNILFQLHVVCTILWFGISAACAKPRGPTCSHMTMAVNNGDIGEDSYLL